MLAVALFYASSSYGQSLGDIARQERERRKQEPRQSSYVYTNEDLRRSQILIPEDRERVLAGRRNESAPEIQAQAVEALELPLPNLSVTMPKPEVAIIPIGTELQAPPTIPVPRMVKIVAKTMRVVVSTVPRLPAQSAPALPIASAKLELPAPPQTIQHRAIQKTASPTQTVLVKLNATPAAAPLPAQLAPVSQDRIVRHKETKEAVALVHFEKTKSNLASKSPSDSILLAESSSRRSVQYRNVVEIVAPTQVTSAKKATVTNIAKPRAKAECSGTVRSVQQPKAQQSIALVSFEKTQSRTTPLPVANVLLAQPASRETVLRHQAQTQVASAPRVSFPAQAQADTQSSEMVRVEHGDSLWKLAKEHLGSGTRWRELAEMNPEISNPGFIRVGDVIRMPNA